MTTVHRDELTRLCEDALVRVGADPRDAQILAEATVEAAMRIDLPAASPPHRRTSPPQ